MGKIKKEPVDESVAEVGNVSIKEEDNYEDKLKYVNAISQPMASKKIAKKCYKLIKKAAKHKTFIRNGLKDVQKMLRKSETGLVLFAGDVTPVDIMCHLPAVCEEKGIPYVYIPSRADLGAAMGVRRGAVCLMVRENDDYKDLFNEVKQDISTLYCPV